MTKFEMKKKEITDIINGMDEYTFFDFMNYIGGSTWGKDIIIPQPVDCDGCKVDGDFDKCEKYCIKRFLESLK